MGSRRQIGKWGERGFQTLITKMEAKKPKSLQINETFSLSRIGVLQAGWTGPYVGHAGGNPRSMEVSDDRKLRPSRISAQRPCSLAACRDSPCRPCGIATPRRPLGFEAKAELDTGQVVMWRRVRG